MLRRGVAVPSVLVLLVVILGYGLRVGHLAAFAAEGELPPLSRIPALPDGAEIVRSTTECASGGCWREVRIAPVAPDTPGDLAEDLGLSTSEQRLPWTLHDPHPVWIWAEGEGTHLVVSMRYWGQELVP
jgi:hypothetical protein